MRYCQFGVSPVNHSDSDSKTKTRSILGELETPSGELTSDSQEKDNILNEFFASVFEDEGSDNLQDFQDRPFTEPLCNTEIT